MEGSRTPGDTADPPTTPKTEAPAPEPAAPADANPKVTARMLQIRELIAQGEYPDRDELAERIVERLPTGKTGRIPTL